MRTRPEPPASCSTASPTVPQPTGSITPSILPAPNLPTRRRTIHTPPPPEPSTVRWGESREEWGGPNGAGGGPKSTDEWDRVCELVVFQTGPADVDDYISGPQASSTCYACHKGPLSGKSYEAHIFPGFSP